MKKSSAILMPLRFAFGVCAVIAAILQAVAVLTNYNTDANYFSQGAILPTVSIIFAVIGAICGTVASLLTDSDTLNTTIFSQKSIPAPATVGFLVAGIFLLLYSHLTPRPSIGIIAAIFLLGSIAYGVLSGSPVFRQKSNLVAFFGFFAVIACILVNAYYYFDVSVEMNAPFKTATQVGLLCAVVYFTGEIRYLLGRPMPRVFLMTASWVVSLGAIPSLSVPIAFFTGKTDRADYAAGALLVFCIVLTALARMNMLLQKQPETDATERI